MNPEDNPPNKKYFKPPLVPLNDLIWEADNIYKVKLCNSKDKYNEIKFWDDINKEPPNTVYSNKNVYSLTSNLG
jgi:hypothetical protein